VGTHCPSFAAGVQAALRQQPDVLLIGDLADGEAARLAVTAAEQGTLVLAALRAASVVKALDRLLECCPPSQRALLRGGLAEVLVGVVAQLLLPAAEGSARRAAVEVLLRTDALPELLRAGDMAAVQQLMQGGKMLGMHTMDESLIELAHEGAVPPHEASRKIMDSALFERRFQS